MAVLKCKMCGGDLNIATEVTVVECEYCGTKQTVPNVDDEKKVNLFSRANRLRFACEFDKAAGVYEAIIADFPEEAEAYWGLVLCKYGIEYVDDPATGKKIPTCHRSSFESVMDDSNFELVMEYADILARGVYRAEAKQIEELRKGIIEVSSKEEPYDIFICYKETAENGERTIDSVIAQDVYTELVNKGYRVFFSRITLEDKLGQQYEPYIFAALNSAKIMLAFGTDYDYYNAVWVKNEWSRFLQLIAAGEKKTLIPCYKDIDAYDMPKEFAKLQAQDMGKVGATQDLLRGIEKILPKETVKSETVVIQQNTNNPTVSSLLERVFIFLEDGKWNEADEYCEKVLDIEPKNAKAYFYKLLAEFKCRNSEKLINSEMPFAENDNFEKAVRFADDTYRKELQAILTSAQEYKNKKGQERREIAEEKRRQEEAEQKRKEDETNKKLEALVKARERIAPATKLISAGFCNTVAVKSDGSVLAVGSNENGKCNVSHWQDMAAIDTSIFNTAGLRNDGTVAIVGSERIDYKVSDYHNIKSLAKGQELLLLKDNGKVIVKPPYGISRYLQWEDIIAVASTGLHYVGLKSNGSVVADGKNESGQCNVSDWQNIVAITAGNEHTVGLKADGTVVAVGNNEWGQCNVENWRDIIAVAAGYYHTVGIRVNGTVVIAGDNKGMEDVDRWQNIVAVAAGCGHVVGLKADGTMVAVGNNNEGQCNVSGFKLFDNIDTLKEERARKSAYRSQGVCQNCGGEFKGLFAKKCSSCGKEKDY